MSGFVVRRATPADADGIASVHMQAWRETYSRLVEPGELNELSVERRAERWRRILNDGGQAWVAVLDGEIVGFAGIGDGGDDAPRALCLESIYLLAGHHGSGAAQALLDAAIGDAPAYLFVAEDNPRATRFYERNRFEFDGTTEEFAFVRTLIVSRRMVR